MIKEILRLINESGVVNESEIAEATKHQPRYGTASNRHVTVKRLPQTRQLDTKLPNSQMRKLRTLQRRGTKRQICPCRYRKREEIPSNSLTFVMQTEDLIADLIQ
jgi:hypothetical protein